MRREKSIEKKKANNLTDRLKKVMTEGLIVIKAKETETARKRMIERKG